MAALKLLVLGPVRLETSDGEPIGRPGAKAKGLLAYLASQPTGCADRDILAGLLWDRCTQAEARHSLRQALLALRVQLGEYADVLLRPDRDSLQLRLEALDVDLLRFKGAIRSQDNGSLIEVCHLWRGSYCDGLDVDAEPFEEWLLLERARLDELAAAGFMRVVEAQLSAGCFEAAVSAAQRCVALNPYDDNAHAILIGLYRRRGWVGPARAAYRRCVDLFRTELGEQPNEAVKRALIAPIGQPSHGAGAGSIRASMDGGECVLAQAPKHQLFPTRRPPVLARYVRAAVFLVATALIASQAANLFIRDDIETSDGMTTVESPKIIAWVGSSMADVGPRENPATAEDSSAQIPVRTDTGPISLEEAISRALQLDPDYAHLYPAGC